MARFLVALLVISCFAIGTLGDVDGDSDIVDLRSFARGLKQLAVPAPSPENGNSSFPLALDRTSRHDPLDNFHIYRGGWDIRSKHYWASVGFTGIPGFILALIWAAFGILGLLFACCYCCCCRHRKAYRHNNSNLIPLVLLFILSCVAIAGSVLLYYSQAKFHDNLSDTLDYVVSQSNITVENLQNVSTTLNEGATVSIFNFQLPDDQKQKILQVSQQLNTTSTQVETKTEDNAHKIRKAINVVRLAMIIVSAASLLLVLLGLAFTACGFRSAVYILVLLTWFLLIGTWILCGVFILLNNAIGDTCVAMEEWVRHPNAHTNLDDILPCMDQATTNQTLLRSKEVSNSVVSLVNKAVAGVLNSNLPSGTPFYINQTGPLVPSLCTPYGAAPDYQDQPCTNGISLEAAPTNWSSYVCKGVSNGVCTTTGRMTPDIYENLRKAVSVSRGLVVNVPFLVNVANCDFVRQTFQEIRTDRCPGLKKYTKYIWIGLVLISTGAMISILFWIHTSRRRHDARHEGYQKNKNGDHPIYGAQTREHP